MLRRITALCRGVEHFLLPEFWKKLLGINGGFILLMVETTYG